MSSTQADRARERLYEVKSANHPVEETLDRILQIGVEYLDVENGHVKRVDQMQGTHEVLAAAGRDEIPIETGDVHDHARTYCRRTLQRETPLAILRASAEGWADDPAYLAHELECYLGTTIEVRGESFGTLCFVSQAPRDREFSPSERAFVDLAAGIAGSRLADRQFRRELTRRDRLIAVLNRVLRHNLRNDLNVVAGYADVLESTLTDDRREMVREIHEVADRLAIQGEKARQLERIARESARPQSRDLVPVLREVVDDLREQYPDATVAVSTPETTRGVATEHLGTALFELGENAIVHGGDPSRATFHLAERENTVAITVADDGVGIPDHERAVLNGSPETALEHGSGVGLWIVYWVVKRSGGSVTVEEGDGTTVEIRLQEPTGDDATR